MTAFDRAWSVVKGSRAPDYHTIKRPSKPVVHLEGEGYVDPNNYEDGKSTMPNWDNPDDPNSLGVRTSMAKPLNLDRLMDQDYMNAGYGGGERYSEEIEQHMIDEMERDVRAGKPRYAMRMPRPEEEEETEQRRQDILAGEWDSD